MTEIKVGQICHFYHADPAAWFGWDCPYDEYESKLDWNQRPRTVLLDHRAFLIIELPKNPEASDEHLILGCQGNKPVFVWVMGSLIMESEEDREEEYEVK